MREVRSTPALLAEPVGSWLAVGPSVVWSASDTLCGLCVWGRPTAAETADIMGAADAYRGMAERFDLMLDAGAVERVEPDAFAVLMRWSATRWDELQRRMRKRAGVIPAGMGGAALAGITPALGGTPVDVLPDLRAGLTHLIGAAGAAIAGELETIVAQVRAVPSLLTALRTELDARRGRATIAETARVLGRSSRSLQRALTEAGVSFRDEQADARFRAAETLLATDVKLAAVAAELGLSEAGLTLLVKTRTGGTPGELRRRLRGE